MGIRTASPLLEPTGAGRRVPARCLHIGVRVTRACGRWARRSPRCSEPGEGRCERSLRPRRTPRRDIGISFVRRSSRFSLDHGFVRSFSRSPRDRASSMSASRPTPVRLRPEAERCATGEISPASVSLSAARWPTRRTACSFSPAVSLGDDGPFARAARPALWAVLSWLLPPPTARPSRGTSRRRSPSGARSDDSSPGASRTRRATSERKPSSHSWTDDACTCAGRPSTSSRGDWWTPTARS